jgi:hypothetical protein
MMVKNELIQPGKTSQNSKDPVKYDLLLFGLGVEGLLRPLNIQ